MSLAIAPSTHSVIHEDSNYLSFPAIVKVRSRLVVIFRTATGNPLDYDSRILITTSDDDGQTWSTPQTWVDLPGCDARNCGGATLNDGRAHFVYDVHSDEGYRRPFVCFSDDGATWEQAIHLDANDPNGPSHQITTVSNQGIEWDDDHIYFPCFRGNSVLYNTRDGSQTQLPMVPRHEPAIAFNHQRELVAFSKGGHIDISYDQGRTWVGASDVDSISQPDLIQLSNGKLLLCYSGKLRRDEWLLLSDDGHDIYSRTPLRIFDGDDCGQLDSRGKAMCIETEYEILTVLYESHGPGKTNRIYLVRTPKNALTL